MKIEDVPSMDGTSFLSSVKEKNNIPQKIAGMSICSGNVCAYSSVIMVQILKEMARNFLRVRRDEKRIEREINAEGLVKFVEKYYGKETSTRKNLNMKHA